MVHPDDVEQSERGAKALNPPGVAILCHHIPAVQRISPQLPGGTEVVRGNAGHHRRIPLLIEMKQRRVGPGIGAVVGHEDRDVPNDADSPLVRVAPQRQPLPEELKLQVSMELDLLVEFCGPPRYGVRIAGGDVCIPLVPGHTTKMIFQRHEQRKIIQPAPIRVAKL